MRAYPNLRHLAYLVALAEHRHFGKAAEASAVTQSTLSAGIRELETMLGIQVAERTKRSVILTPIGHVLAEKAQALLRSEGTEAERLALDLRYTREVSVWLDLKIMVWTLSRLTGKGAN